MKTTLGIPHNGDNFKYPYINSLVGTCLYEANKPYLALREALKPIARELGEDHPVVLKLIEAVAEAEDSRLLGSIIPHGGPYVDDNRNGIVINHAERTTDDWVLMIDPDIEFPANILDLHAVHTKNYPEAKVIAGRVNLLNGLPVFYFQEKDANIHYTFPFTGLKEFDRIGTGIIFINRDALAKMGMNLKTVHLFSRILLSNDILLGDDFSFCERARQCGIRLYGAWDIVGLHHKTYLVPQRYLEFKDIKISVPGGGVVPENVPKKEV